MQVNQLTEVTNSSQNLEVTRIFLLNAKPEIVIEYLRSSHWKYEHELIPKIEQDFSALIKHIPNASSLPVIFKLFLKFQMDLKMHMQIEEQLIYPTFLANPLSEKLRSSDSESHEDHEPFLREIIQLIGNSSFSSNPFCQVLLSRLNHFESELKEHAWIEENIIFMSHS